MGSKTKFDPGRRDFLKKTGRGIAGAAAATAFPGGTGGGIMEQRLLKKLVFLWEEYPLRHESLWT